MLRARHLSLYQLRSPAEQGSPGVEWMDGWTTKGMSSRFTGKGTGSENAQDLPQVPW